MRLFRDFKSMWVMGSVLVVLVGFCLVPSLGMARVEMSDGVGDVQGDPGDALGCSGSEVDLEDGSIGPLARLLGDAGDGMDPQGDPDDSLDYFRIFCNPGDFVLGHEVTLFFGYFRIP